MNGTGPNGLHFNGLHFNGLHFNGQPIDGVLLNGLHFNSLQLNGLHFNSLQLNGLHFNGLHFNSLQLNGLHFNGLHFNGLHFNGLHFNGSPIDSAESATLLDAIEIMTECALPAGQCITVTDLSDTGHTFCGDAGLDPGWDSGPPDLGKYDDMAQCVIDRGTAAGHTVTHEPVHIDTFKTVLRYLVECALPDNTTVTVYDENEVAIPYQGALGLAPEWETGPMLEAGRKLVSACLAARTNALGQTVQISLRGGGLPVDPVEKRVFAQHEGAFAADLFAPVPYVKSCDAEGGISGRICASDSASCGFTPLGDCKAVCTESSDSGVYSDCDSGAETHVISTFLALDRSVAFGEQHTCVRQVSGSVECWGHNAHGQLGNGTTTNGTISTPTAVAGLSGKSASLASSYQHTCARGINGSLHCWGANGSGQLGDGTTTLQTSAVQVQSLALDVAQVSTADKNTCATTTSGALWCWGANEYGQLGDGGNSGSTGSVTPQQVPGIAGAVKVAAGRHTCAANAAGDLWCWGHNDEGQLGDCDKANQSDPVCLSSGTTVDVCVGYRHSCSLNANGTVQCWGYNTLGQLGDGTSTSRETPALVVNLFANATSIGCGYDHTCALLDNGTVWCWGSNGYGQVGKGQATTREKTPVQVVGIPRAHDVIVGRDYNCAELEDRSLWCWGWNEYGQLGNGTADYEPAPVRMLNYSCGDGVCDTAGQEDALNCPADCATSGDGVCSAGEDCQSDPADCPVCTPVCGDGTCEADKEDCSSCASDCGFCPPVCGNGTCVAGVDYGVCPANYGECATTATCEPTGGFCDENSDCCSGSCRNRKNKCR